jgi:antirestriction protein ArdC
MAKVRKGEKAHLIVLDKIFEKEGTDEETGEQEIVKGFVLKSSSVFNANQVDGFKIPEIETSQTTTQLDNVESFIKKQVLGFFIEILLHVTSQ